VIRIFIARLKQGRERQKKIVKVKDKEKKDEEKEDF
jgi:hypothetical protein